MPAPGLIDVALDGADWWLARNHATEERP
jgi:hypothetical protein